jgi:hypothetical protein
MWTNIFRAGQAIDDNLAHAQYMPDNEGYKHTLTICITCCFSTTTMVAPKLLYDTLYVRRLSYFRDTEVPKEQYYYYYYYYYYYNIMLTNKMHFLN